MLAGVDAAVRSRGDKEMRARSRRKVLSKFSPYLAEEVVWELDKKGRVRVPCVSLVAERLSGDELRFFVKVALAMDVSVLRSRA